MLNHTEKREALRARLSRDPALSSTGLAAEFHVSPETVKAIQDELGIEAKRGRPFGGASEDIRALFAQGLTTQQVADQVNVSYQHAYSVLRRSKDISRQAIDWDAEPQLGKVPDPVLAEKYGVGSSAVVKARRSRGIPPCLVPRGVDWDAESQLGKVPDPVLAKKYRVQSSVVASARRRRNIPIFQPSGNT